MFKSKYKEEEKRVYIKFNKWIKQNLLSYLKFLYLVRQVKNIMNEAKQTSNTINI